MGVNILSIDWDWFVDTDVVTRVNEFPDCPSENYPEEIMNIIWSGYYNKMGWEEKVGIKRKELEFVKSIVDSCKLVEIQESHVHILEFIARNFSNGVNVWNVDFHHDAYGTENDTYDCSSWATFGKRNGIINKLVWVGDRNGSELLPNPKVRMSKTINVGVLSGVKFDGIYICKSSPWSPPHLDRWYDELTGKKTDRFERVKEITDGTK
jgi:hypothetical protein